MPLSLEDKAAIQELAARYNQAIDRGDADTWLATWTADGRYHDSLRNVGGAWKFRHRKVTFDG